jgi:hypothetical protein
MNTTFIDFFFFIFLQLRNPFIGIAYSLPPLFKTTYFSAFVDKTIVKFGHELTSG